MERKEGYYWVRLDDPFFNHWHIALWHDNDGGYEDGDWCWHTPYIEGKSDDSDFLEINETRIPTPDEIIA
jgi:hypothetical protein